eukprot:scaffold31698_cov66-Phaeocystis_antarctica.AAC.2
MDRVKSTACHPPLSIRRKYTWYSERAIIAACARFTSENSSCDSTDQGPAARTTSDATAQPGASGSARSRGVGTSAAGLRRRSASPCSNARARSRVRTSRWWSGDQWRDRTSHSVNVSPWKCLLTASAVMLTEGPRCTSRQAP